MQYLASGQDSFTGCAACGDFGRRMLTLAALRRAGLIDRSSRLTDIGRTLLPPCTA